MIGGIYPNNGKGAPHMVRFKNITRRFKSLPEAERFLNGLRFKYDEGTFDPQDYRADNPLGFENLAKRWIGIQFKRKKLKNPQSKRWAIGKATDYFANRNIKTIGYGEIEDFLLTLENLSEKSQFNILATIKQFLKWVDKREKFYEMPQELPIISEPTMKMRKTISKDRQMAILDKLKGLTWYKNPKIYIACEWLSTYPQVRPVELLDILEGDIDLTMGIINVSHDKTGDESGKKIYLIQEDIELIESFPTAFPNLPFFRHDRARKGIPRTMVGQKLSESMLNKWWYKAQDALKIPKDEQVPVYPGTRHSSVKYLGQYLTPEEVMQDGSQHRTTKAFLRYFPVSSEKRRHIAELSRGDTKVIRNFDHPEKANPPKSHIKTGRHDGI